MIASSNSTAKESEIHGQKLKKPSKFEDYWSSSTFDMDNSAFQSQGSISSLSTSTVGPQVVLITPVPIQNSLIMVILLGVIGVLDVIYSVQPVEIFVTRQRWIGNKKSENLVQQPGEPELNWNVKYESLLRSDKPFPHPIPLSEMVDFLVDTWEQEGLYD